MAAAFERDQIGKRQELADIIANIEVEGTVVTSMAKKESAPNQILQEYQAEVYPDTGFEGVLDGKDADDFNAVPRYPLKARSMKVWQNPKVTDFAEKSVIAGVSGRGEMKRQKAIALVLCKRKMERAVLSDMAAQEDNGTVANQTQGLSIWLDPTATTLYPIDNAVRTPADSKYSGTLAALTEESLVNILASSYNARKTKADLDLVCGSALKRKLSRYSYYTDDSSSQTVVRRMNNQNDGKLIEVIDHLETDFGTINMHLSSFLYTDKTTGAISAKTTRSGYLLDTDMLAICYTRLPRIMDLPDLGGGPRAIVDAMFSLKYYNPKGSGKLEISS